VVMKRHPFKFVSLIAFTLAVAFVVFCLVDLARSPAVAYLPKWAWAIVCVISVPLGGIVYLLVGRKTR